MGLFKRKCNILPVIFISLLCILPLVATLNTDCNGKSFHCVNSTHFMICVDVGGGLSMTIDSFVIQCPPTTVCRSSNSFECEYQESTTQKAFVKSEVTNDDKILNVISLVDVNYATPLPTEKDINDVVPLNNEAISLHEERLLAKSTITNSTKNTNVTYSEVNKNKSQPFSLYPNNTISGNNTEPSKKDDQAAVIPTKLVSSDFNDNSSNIKNRNGFLNKVHIVTSTHLIQNISYNNDNLTNNRSKYNSIVESKVLSPNTLKQEILREKNQTPSIIDGSGNFNSLIKTKVSNEDNKKFSEFTSNMAVIEKLNATMEQNSNFNNTIAPNTLRKSSSADIATGTDIQDLNFTVNEVSEKLVQNINLTERVKVTAAQQNFAEFADSGKEKDTSLTIDELTTDPVTYTFMNHSDIEITTEALSILKSQPSPKTNTHKEGEQYDTTKITPLDIQRSKNLTDLLSFRSNASIQESTITKNSSKLLQNNDTSISSMSSVINDSLISTTHRNDTNCLSDKLKATTESTFYNLHVTDNMINASKINVKCANVSINNSNLPTVSNNDSEDLSINIPEGGNNKIDHQQFALDMNVTNSFPYGKPIEKIKDESIVYDINLTNYSDKSIYLPYNSTIYKSSYKIDLTPKSQNSNNSTDINVLLIKSTNIHNEALEQFKVKDKSIFNDTGREILSKGDYKSNASEMNTLTNKHEVKPADIKHGTRKELIATDIELLATARSSEINFEKMVTQAPLENRYFDENEESKLLDKNSGYNSSIVEEISNQVIENNETLSNITFNKNINDLSGQYSISANTSEKIIIKNNISSTILYNLNSTIDNEPENFVKNYSLTTLTPVTEYFKNIQNMTDVYNGNGNDTNTSKNLLLLNETFNSLPSYFDHSIDTTLSTIDKLEMESVTDSLIKNFSTDQITTETFLTLLQQNSSQAKSEIKDKLHDSFTITSTDVKQNSYVTDLLPFFTNVSGQEFINSTEYNAEKSNTLNSKAKVSSRDITSSNLDINEKSFNSSSINKKNISLSRGTLNYPIILKEIEFSTKTVLTEKPDKDSSNDQLPKIRSPYKFLEYDADWVTDGTNPLNSHSTDTLENEPILDENIFSNNSYNRHDALPLANLYKSSKDSVLNLNFLNTTEKIEQLPKNINVSHETLEQIIHGKNSSTNDNHKEKLHNKQDVLDAGIKNSTILSNDKKPLHLESSTNKDLTVLDANSVPTFNSPGITSDFIVAQKQAENRNVMNKTFKLGNIDDIKNYNIFVDIDPLKINNNNNMSQVHEALGITRGQMLQEESDGIMTNVKNCSKSAERSFLEKQTEKTIKLPNYYGGEETFDTAHDPNHPLVNKFIANNNILIQNESKLDTKQDTNNVTNYKHNSNIIQYVTETTTVKGAENTSLYERNSLDINIYNFSTVNKNVTDTLISNNKTETVKNVTDYFDNEVEIFYNGKSIIADDMNATDPIIRTIFFSNLTSPYGSNKTHENFEANQLKIKPSSQNVQAYMFINDTADETVKGQKLSKLNELNEHAKHSKKKNNTTDSSSTLSIIDNVTPNVQPHDIIFNNLPFIRILPQQKKYDSYVPINEPLKRNVVSNNNAIDDNLEQKSIKANVTAESELKNSVEHRIIDHETYSNKKVFLSSNVSTNLNEETTVEKVGNEANNKSDLSYADNLSKSLSPESVIVLRNGISEKEQAIQRINITYNVKNLSTITKNAGIEKSIVDGKSILHNIKNSTVPLLESLSNGQRVNELHEIAKYDLELLPNANNSKDKYDHSLNDNKTIYERNLITVDSEHKLKNIDNNKEGIVGAPYLFNKPMLINNVGEPKLENKNISLVKENFTYIKLSDALAIIKGYGIHNVTAEGSKVNENLSNATGLLNRDSNTFNGYAKDISGTSKVTHSIGESVANFDVVGQIKHNQVDKNILSLMENSTLPTLRPLTSDVPINKIKNWTSEDVNNYTDKQEIFKGTLEILPNATVGLVNSDKITVFRNKSMVINQAVDEIKPNQDHENIFFAVENSTNPATLKIISTPTNSKDIIHNKINDITNTTKLLYISDPQNNSTLIHKAVHTIKPTLRMSFASHFDDGIEKEKNSNVKLPTVNKKVEEEEGNTLKLPKNLTKEVITTTELYNNSVLINDLFEVNNITDTIHNFDSRLISKLNETSDLSKPGINDTNDVNSSFFIGHAGFMYNINKTQINNTNKNSKVNKKSLNDSIQTFNDDTGNAILEYTAALQSPTIHVDQSSLIINNTKLKNKFDGAKNDDFTVNPVINTKLKAFGTAISAVQSTTTLKKSMQSNKEIVYPKSPKVYPMESDGALLMSTSMKNIVFSNLTANDHGPLTERLKTNINPLKNKSINFSTASALENPAKSEFLMPKQPATRILYRKINNTINLSNTNTNTGKILSNKDTESVQTSLDNTFFTIPSVTSNIVKRDPENGSPNLKHVNITTLNKNNVATSINEKYNTHSKSVNNSSLSRVSNIETVSENSTLVDGYRNSNLWQRYGINGTWKVIQKYQVTNQVTKTATKSGIMTSTVSSILFKIEKNKANDTINAKELFKNLNPTPTPILVCRLNSRGRFADKNNCRRFHICIGNQVPMLGLCPLNTVFSELTKQCTRNLAHCTRNNQFKCIKEGRYTNVLDNTTFYLCVKSSDQSFVRFKFHCQSGYRLNRTTVTCNKEIPMTTTLSSMSSMSSNDEDIEVTTKSSAKQPLPVFRCKSEGKFEDQTNRKRYYVCSKTSKSILRRKRKKCNSGEIFDEEESKCVHKDSDDSS